MSAYSVEFNNRLSLDICRSLPQLKPVLPDAVKCREILSSGKCSVMTYAAVSQYVSSLTKVIEEKAVDADSLAIEKFVKTNNQCESYVVHQLPLNSVHALVEGEIKKAFYKFTYDPVFEPTIENIGRRLSAGPGASAGVKYTSFYHKIGDAKLTTSSKYLYEYYKYCIAVWPAWRDAEYIRQSNHGLPRVIPGSTLSCVPKRTDISRTICTEPSLNMFFQLGLGSLLTEYLSLTFGLRIKHHPLGSPQQFVNRELARRASSTGEFSTIDLSSASDSFSLKMLQSIVPKKFFDMMSLLRSPVTVLPNGETLALHMMSSMGNGFTFPLETFFFAALVRACYIALGIKPLYPRGKALGNFGVYGDDLIVRSDAFDLVVTMLHHYGFELNPKKTFSTGSFRESCGGDYLNGHDVRPVFCKTVRTLQGRTSFINRLNTWSAKHSIFLPRTIEFLMDGHEFNHVPPWESDDSGLKVPFCMTSPKYDKDTRSYVYYAWAPKTLSYSLAAKPPYLRWPRGVNPEAVFVTALRGDLRDTRLNLRMKEVRYAKRRRIAPCWDYMLPNSHDFYDYGPQLQMWIAAAMANLGRV